MNREEFVNWVNNLENSYPVNEWLINEVQVWPLIKVKLLFYSGKTTIKKQKGLSKWQKLLNSVKGGIDYINLTVKAKSKHSTVLYSIAPHFRFLNEDKIYVNRYYNQLIRKSLISENKDFRIFDYGEVEPDYKLNTDYVEKTIFLGNLKYFALFRRDLSVAFKKEDIHLPEFDDFLKEITNKIGPNSINRRSILKQVVYIEKLKDIYIKLLVKLKVEEVYILCYYVSEMYAMAMAANQLGISSCDIQHGGQGRLHLAYSGFNSIPENGYKLLPKRFWVWDKDSYLEIEKWIAKQNYHEVFINGNPWIEYCVKQYTSKVNTNKKIILYTMQPVGEHLLDPYIIEAIDKTPPDYIWWLRLHPRQLKQKAELNILLAKYSLLDKVNIEDATRLPLPGILIKTHIHLSKYSGSILEAYLMKVKTIILSDIGVESFPNVVESDYGIINKEKDANKLLDQIRNI
ncbi:hypothetical protein [Christiangramia portivictoriae]|uniref:hypothetical protein n=1 Tax=Christiangramia portivictoriae TaxID=326069 RepID=UPI000419CFBB|nr:hypothetical protein [Christiangramia portivictoriae]